MEIDREQALAFRIAGQHLHRRTDPETAIAACGLQEYPPGWAAIALHARARGQPDSTELVTVNALRGAPYVVPRRDVGVFTAALVPDDDEGLEVLVGRVATLEAKAGGLSARQGLELVAEAARDCLADGPLDRDEFHQALRERLPESLLPWCGGCKSHHVRPGFWRKLGPLGVTEMPGKATYALAKPSRAPIAGSRAELVRRFLRCFGPATHSHLAAWGQTAPSHAKALFAGVESELEQISLEGGRRWVLAEDLSRLEAPAQARGVRMIGGHDPYVGQPDRETLVPDKTLRKKMFPAIGRPGVVLRDGSMAGLWKGRKKGNVLEIETEWLGPEVDLGREAKAIARLRGCESAHLLS